MEEHEEREQLVKEQLVEEHEEREQLVEGHEESSS